MSPIDQGLAYQGFTIKDGVVYACNGLGLKNLFLAGKQWLEVHVNIVNGLNVFPVPDGDTGTNMYLTMQSAWQYVEQTTDHGAGSVAAAAAQGALMGARGNSGVILAEFLQGLALGLEGKVTFTSVDFTQAAKLGVERAYQGVANPVEGTILTVARATVEAAQQEVRTDPDLTRLLAKMVQVARVTQAATPDLLPVLKEAGVTDSGGQGLLYILEGGLRFMGNRPVDLDPNSEIVPPLQSTMGVGDQTYGYDVQFLIQGEQLDVAEIRTHIDSLGWSTVVVGNEKTVKVHVHADDPGLPLSYAVGLGQVSDVLVENMEEQAKAFVYDHTAPFLQLAGFDNRTSRATTTNIAVIAVALGQGLIDIFQSLGVDRVICGEQTMNPSIQEFLDVIEQMSAEHVLILPNNSDILLTAQQVQEFSQKPIAVVPTKTVPQGISALLAFNDQVDLKTNVQRMINAAKQVRTIEVARAVQPIISNGFRSKADEVIGILDNDLVETGQDFNKVALDILAQLETDEYEIITIYFGQDSSREHADILSYNINKFYPELEVEIHRGDQPRHYYIISLE
jgi:DAK2 domain fusion protein YloV